MKIYYTPEAKDWNQIIDRQKTNPSKEVQTIVSQILANVKTGGDRQILEYSEKLDGLKTNAEGLRVSEDEIQSAAQELDEELKNSILIAANNIRKFHEAQRTEDPIVETYPGVICRQKTVPIKNVGLYIPGGTAPLFSTVLMLGIPASIAGCDRVVLCSPPAKNGKIAPVILFTAAVCGIKEIYRIGGAVAIGAMAYGTATVPKVDKIFGPGNSFVMEAKKQISSICAIDMPAGPSEVMILADESARADFVSADFLSQLEHGKDSQAVLVTTSTTLAEQVTQEIERQAAKLSRRDLVAQSMEKSLAIVVKTPEELVEMANLYAPEHLIIQTTDYNKTLEGIRNAGSIFLGHYATESAGDYASGTNHTLPTGGWATAYSGVNLLTFQKKMTVQEISKAGLEKLGPVIERMAMAEGLDAHANAVRVRIKKETL